MFGHARHERHHGHGGEGRRGHGRGRGQLGRGRIGRGTEVNKEGDGVEFRPAGVERTAQPMAATCPLCENHCPLSAPSCGKGRAYARNLGAL